jgi:hypothetical protein
MRTPSCLAIPPHQLLNALTSLCGTWHVPITVTEPITTAAIISPCDFMCIPPEVARQKICKLYPPPFFFSFLDNNSIKMSPMYRSKQNRRLVIRTDSHFFVWSP